MTKADNIRAVLAKLNRGPIEHAIFKDKLRDIVSTAEFAIPGTIILLTGAAGAGVLSIARAIRSEFNKGSSNPYAAIEVSARFPTEGRHNWGSMYEAGLNALNEPVFGIKRRATESPIGVTEFSGRPEFRGPNQYRSDLENALQRKSCRVITVTHAHHMMRRLPENELDVPMQIFHQITRSRNQTPSVAVLAGRHELLKLRHISSDLDLHTTVVHVPFFSKNEKQAADFVELLDGFEQCLDGLIENHLLRSHAKEMFEAHLGGAGWVKRSLVRSLARLEQSKSAMLTWKLLEPCFPSKRELDVLAADIAYGERMLSPVKGSAATSDTPPDQKEGRMGTKARRVGERGPSRDPTGGAT